MIDRRKLNSIAVSILLLGLVAFGVLVNRGVRSPLTPKVLPDMEAREPPRVELIEFGDRTLVFLPTQEKNSMTFLSPRAGDLLVLFYEKRLAGCYRAFRVGGTITLAPSPDCGKEVGR